MQNQHDKENAFAEVAGPLCFVGAVVSSYGKLLGYFFLVVGRETHGLLLAALVSRVDGTCACVKMNTSRMTFQPHDIPIAHKSL